MSAPMVRASLNNTKRQTRRIAKLHKSLPNGRGFDCIKNLTSGGLVPIIGGIPQWSPAGGDPYRPYPHIEQCCPYGMPGDRLWVRETWSPDATTMYPCPAFWYRATDTIESDGVHTCPPQSKGNYADCLACWEERHQKFRWRPSIHMPRRASRLTLELTRVRIERLHDITEADAWAEGIGREVGRERPLEALFNVCMAFPKLNIGALAADDPTLFTFGDDRSTPTDYERVVATTGRGVYAALWEGINGPGSWAANPWVWVLDFRRV